MAENPTLRAGDETVDGWVEYLQEVLNYNLLFLGTSTQVEKNGRFDDATEFSGPSSVDCDLFLVPDGQSTPPGDTFWFESEDLVLGPGEFSYTVTLPNELGGDSMSGSFTVE